MMRSALDTAFEMSLRILLLLSTTSSAYSVDMLALADTLTIYGGNFGITEGNLHGESHYVLDEYDARRELSKEAVKNLAMRGLIVVLRGSEGFHYKVTDMGKQFINGNKSEYADEYRSAARKTVSFIDGRTERELFLLMSGRKTMTEWDNG
jgi:hypothetical protein